MIKHKITGRMLLPAAFVFIALSSCNSNPDSIPFPEKNLEFSQPTSEPLLFSESRNLQWDTAKKGKVSPVIKRLDIDALPSASYDGTGFKTFSRQPEKSSFSFNSLPDSAFNFNALPSKSLQFKTAVLNVPTITKVTAPVAQKDNPLAIYDLGPQQGMPALFVTCLLKDSHGLLWVASKEGLFRYDGEHIRTFIQGPSEVFISGMAEDDKGRIWFIDQISIGMIDPQMGTISRSTLNGVPINNLSKIIKDKTGRIWISKTNTKSVIIIDPVTRTYKSLSKSEGLTDTEGSNDITEDDAGNIWISTPNMGATIINPQTNKIKYLKKVNGLATDSLRAITKDKNGKIWISIISGGVEAVDASQGTITHYNEAQGLRKAFTGDISSDNKGQIWIGKNQGIDVLDPENGRSRLINQSNGLGQNWVASCTIDNDNRMWIATIGGLHIIEQNAETVKPLGSQQIISVMEDTIGNIWVATQNGIQLINVPKKTIRRLDKSNGLRDNFIQSFAQFDHQVWVTSDGGFDIIDPIRKTIEHTGKAEGLINDTVYAVLKDKRGNTWFTGPSNGIDLIDSAKKMILHTDVSRGLNDNNIVDAKVDREGLVWLAGSIGVSVVDLASGKIKYLNNQPGLKDTCNKMILEDDDGRIWIGTDKGIYIADKKNSTLTTITSRNGLSDNRVLSLLPYKRSVIAGTGNKVTMITPPSHEDAKSIDSTAGKTTGSNWKVELLHKSDGLIREVTNAWSTDGITKNGNFLWGDNSLSIIYDIKAQEDYSTTYITGISILNKLQNFTDKISLEEKDSLWSEDTVYVTGQLPVNTGYTESKVLKWDSVSGPYNLPVNLSIPYDNNYIQIHFAQSHLGRQDGASYVYVLEGIDRSWSNITTNPYTENYLNLPSGTYTFKVRSRGKNNKWSEPAVFHFTITPPWWKTWWAYILYAMTGLGALRAYISYRSSRLKRENKILEEKISLRTNQLQQSLEDLKTTQAQLIQSEKMASLGELTAGIAHEIQNPLNFVNNFSEVSIELANDLKDEISSIELPGNKKETVSEIINDIVKNQEKINFHGRRADAIVKGMLQHSRGTSGQKEPTDINGLADEYLRLSYHGLRAKDKFFNAVMTTDFDKAIPLINIVPQDIGRVLLNLFTNAFYSTNQKKKTNPDNYEPSVSVTTKKLPARVEIRVSDNGMGIPQKVLDKIFHPFFTTKVTGEGTGLGLSLSYDIVKAHGGEIKVETKEGEGAQFVILLPL